MRSDIVRTRVRTGLRRVLCGGERSIEVVPTLLRDLDDDERRAIKDAVFGIAVQRLRLLHDHPPPVNDSDFDVLVQRWSAGDGRDDALVVDAPDAAGDVRLDRLAVRRSCPRWLAAELVESLGFDAADTFLAVSNRPGPRTLRANVLVNDRATLVQALGDEGITVRLNDRTPWAVDVVGRANLSGCAAFRAGRFEVQDASSQAVVVAAGVGPGEVVIDLCAGRGGKTLALAAAMGDRGTLWFHDIDPGALADLRGRLRRAHVHCARAGLPAEAVADVVVVDAPCTSVGVLRRSPDLRFTLGRDHRKSLGPVQRTLLDDAVRRVRPGGRVVYATCSVLRDENDAVVDDVLARHPDLTAVTRTLLVPQADEDGDGFFIAVLRRGR
jgi:16S rRNA (cytosine967-C5)-methyltransferase